MTHRTLSFCLPFLLFLASCSHSTTQDQNLQNPTTRQVAGDNEEQDWILQLPGADEAGDYLPLVTEKVARILKKQPTDAAVTQKAQRISRYVSFMMKGCSETKGKTVKNCNKQDGPQKLLSRLFKSSTQFIFCPSLNDVACLERIPEIPIQAGYRVENPALGLGNAKRLNVKLDDISEYSFTEQIFVPDQKVDLTKTMAALLARKIEADGRSAIYGAVYGIDDHNESMKSVYDALIGQINAGVDVKAVFDQEIKDRAKIRARGDLLPFIFSYKRPPQKDIDRWIFSPFSPPGPTRIIDQTVLPFQYNGGTQGLILALSRNAKNAEDAKGRIEWPDDGIMHNKFFVFKNQNNMSVWTGTANVSQTCMGRERNSNMSFYVKNNDIAQVFIDEFNEMYNYASVAPDDSKKSDSDDDSDEEDSGDQGEASSGSNAVMDPKYPLQHGKFKNDKTANTHRYFTLTENTNSAADDTDFRIYFSPTDDAEHRAIMPMLLSARRGDIIRISMFGAAGIQYVRAMQWAASRGVKIEIIIDSPTGYAVGSWMSSAKADATLLESNPFGEGRIEVRKNSSQHAKQLLGINEPGDLWKQNHQKIGLLLRRQSNGTLKAEQLIFGSQNWSASGNDKNDENLISLRNRTLGLKVGDAFNRHFTEFLWPMAMPAN